jgi:hypothetical protein
VYSFCSKKNQDKERLRYKHKRLESVFGYVGVFENDVVAPAKRHWIMSVKSYSHGGFSVFETGRDWQRHT